MIKHKYNFFEKEEAVHWIIDFKDGCKLGFNDLGEFYWYRTGVSKQYRIMQLKTEEWLRLIKH